MKKISSRSTMLYKRIFPVVWCLFLASFVAAALAHGRRFDNDLWAFVVVPCFMTVVGIVVMKNFVWNLMDEVHDGGDYLLVRKGSDEERIPLSNVMNVNASTHMNPPRITLRLVKPGRFGSEVSFSPVSGLRFNRFAKNPVAEDLIVRAYEARTKRA